MEGYVIITRLAHEDERIEKIERWLSTSECWWREEELDDGRIEIAVWTHSDYADKLFAEMSEELGFDVSTLPV